MRPQSWLRYGTPDIFGRSETTHKERDVKLIASILAISIAAVTSAAAADLAGVALGSSANARSLEKLGITSLDENVSAGVHRGKTKFEYVDANSEVTVDGAGRISSLEIDFPTIQAPSILEMAMKKWGKPADSGRSFFAGHLLEVWIWTRDGAEITLNSYDPHFETGSLTRGSLVMVTTASADAARGPKGGTL